MFGARDAEPDCQLSQDPTGRQGKSGLGLGAQRAAVAAHLASGTWTLLDEMVEVESGKATADRPQLARAMALCRLTGATLFVAKLDRLSRDAQFLIGLDKADVDFMAVDMPNANTLTVGIMALVAQQEREATSVRTKAALAAAKARGTKLGGYRGVSPPDPAKASTGRCQGRPFCIPCRTACSRAAGIRHDVGSCFPRVDSAGCQDSTGWVLDRSGS